VRQSRKQLHRARTRIIEQCPWRCGSDPGAAYRYRNGTIDVAREAVDRGAGRCAPKTTQPSTNLDPARRLAVGLVVVLWSPVSWPTTTTSVRSSTTRRSATFNGVHGEHPAHRLDRPMRAQGTERGVRTVLAGVTASTATSTWSSISIPAPAPCRCSRFLATSSSPTPGKPGQQDRRRARRGLASWSPRSRRTSRSRSTTT